MPSAFLRSSNNNNNNTSLTGKIVAIGSLLVAANVIVWTCALVVFHDHPVLLGTSLLAYGFGLRHAVDADHIAAIDNVTRKLMQEGKRPLAAGLFFSLGHSTVVILATIGIVVATTAFQHRLEDFRALGGLIGVSLSSAFLLIIAAINIAILVNVYKAFQRVKRGAPYVADDLDLMLVQGGLLARIFRRLFRMVQHSWHMYPLGFLFGLGFDTATEIGLLGIAAAQASNGLPIWSILVFPALFTAGMTLIDTADSILMTGAYGWALAKPVRKLYYNLTITFASVVVAVLIGGVQALNLIASKLELSGGLWDAVADLNDVFGALGFVIVGVFVVCWLGSMLIYRLRGYDHIETSPRHDPVETAPTSAHSRPSLA
jgi:nickel/cobalt transporter (NiCoT) family protein